MLNLLAPISNLVGTYLSGKIKNKAAENNLKLEQTKARASIAKRVTSGELDWNQSMADASGNSFKDEWLTLLVSIPLILAFTGNEELVVRGFTALDGMPEYYQTALGVVFAASFGVQKLTQMFKAKKA